MLVAVGYHSTPREGLKDSVCCSQVPCFSPAQSPDVFAASIGAGCEPEPSGAGSLSLLEHPALCSCVQ